jgi:hypothetical protein
MLTASDNAPPRTVALVLRARNALSLTKPPDGGKRGMRSERQPPSPPSARASVQDMLARATPAAPVSAAPPPETPALHLLHDSSVTLICALASADVQRAAPSTPAEAPETRTSLTLAEEKPLRAMQPPLPDAATCTHETLCSTGAKTACV